MTNYCVAGSHCVAPPSPPNDTNLVLTDFDPQSPPSHGQTITYHCNTDGYNRFEEDFEQSSLTLDCLPENKFSLNTTWPKCVASNNNIKVTMD